MAKNFETLEDLLKEDIHGILEDEKNYYVKLELGPDEYYDDSLWVVSKDTGNVSYMSSIEFTLFSGLADGATPVDPSTLKRAS